MTTLIDDGNSLVSPHTFDGQLIHTNCTRILPLVQIGPDGAQYLSLALAQGQSLVTLKANGCALGDEVRVTLVLSPLSISQTIPDAHKRTHTVS